MNFSKSKPHIQNPSGKIADMVIILVSLNWRGLSFDIGIYFWGAATLKNTFFRAFGKVKSKKSILKPKNGFFKDFQKRSKITSEHVWVKKNIFGDPDNSSGPFLNHLELSRTL